MEQQVLSIEQMRHLQELGVDTSKASMYWNRIVRPSNKPNTEDVVVLDWFVNTHKEVMHTPFDRLDVVPAFTLQDILDLLPEEIYTEENELATLKIHFPNDGYWEFSYMGLHKCMEFFLEENVLDAAYEMLCWCIEQGYVETKRVK